MNRDFLVVCGIDIGVSKSCCFFSTREDFVHAPSRNIHAVLSLAEGEEFKQVQCFLLDSNSGVTRCISIGEDAEKKYNEQVEKGCQDSFFFFKDLKTILYDRTNFKKSSKLQATNGKYLEAKNVFAAVLHFLKNEAEKMFQVEQSEIRWIIPVPVSWNRVAVEFMKEAAEKALIRPWQVLLVKESDAAVVLSKYESKDIWHTLGADGLKYMVLDCGGRKTDISVYHTKQNSGTVEIHKASFSGIGGNLSNEMFWNLLSDICGKENVDDFKEEKYFEAKVLSRDFDYKSLNVDKDTPEIRIRLPLYLRNIFYERHSGTISLPSKYLGKIHLKRDILVIRSPIIQDMIEKICNKLKTFIDPLLANKNLVDLKMVIAVGVMSSSPIVQAFLRRTFPNVIISEEPSMSVLKGAILYGHDPNIFQVDRDRINHVVVAAIDFGTTYSGFAFSSVSQFKSNPQEIMSCTWQNEHGSSFKTSTCVLFKPNGKLHSVGFDAEEKYGVLTADEEETEEFKDWYFFKRFKMHLYQQNKFDRDFVLVAENEKTMDALVVFSAVIRYMKERMKKECDEKVAGVLDSEIKWILTVPAIWTDSAKQFMREAADKAGIDPHQLCFALEPEAASLFCRYSPIEKRDGEIMKMAETDYMVLDCGGGTVDITVHRIIGNGLIKELYKANGGNWGGTTVDDAFWSMMVEILGQDVIDNFKSQDKYAELEVNGSFERKKKNIDATSNDAVIIFIPASLAELVKKKRRKTIAKVFESNEKYKANVKVFKDKMKISPDLMRSFFEYACTSIVAHLQDLFKRSELSSVDTILMVGGFSESPILKHAVKTKFPGMRVLVPYNAGIAVLNGAVLFGHEPETVHSRVCRFTYGVETSLPFEADVDDRKYLFKDRKGRQMCRKRFQVHIKEGDEVVVDSASKYQVIEVEDRDEYHVTLPVYVSEKGCPRYTTDCTKIGEVKIDIDDRCSEDIRKYKVEMSFGYIESTVKVTDIKTGQSVTSKFDFLG